MVACVHQKGCRCRFIRFSITSLVGLSENSLVERLLSIASKKGENAPAFLSERMGLLRIWMVFNYFFFIIVKVFPNVKYKKNNESKE
jgi:hypothetical protein